MPSPKTPCPTCGEPKSAQSQQCRKCAPIGTYPRTPELRAKIAAAHQGIPLPMLQGRKRPEHSRILKEWWTPERREEQRQRLLLRNPMARYHGLSAKGAIALREALGHCERCQQTGEESRLEVHHRNRDKRDQTLGNLMILCHRCHMQEHATTAETGWDSYHRKRRS